MKPKNPAAVALGSLGGKANTPAQNRARAANGKKGGRPRKRPQPQEKEARKKDNHNG